MDIFYVHPTIYSGGEGMAKNMDVNDRDIRSFVQGLLVAAYLIGYSVTDEDLKTCPWMKLAEGPSDTGVIITYNTEGPGSTGSPVYVKGAGAINPLNWRTDGTVADSSQNIGAVFFDDGKGTIIAEEPHFCAAQVDTIKGVLLATDLKTATEYGIDSPGRYPEGVYHRYDYAFWWKNLQQNVGVRIKSYIEKTK